VAVIKADAIKPQDAVVARDNYDYFLLDRNLAPRTLNLAERNGRTYMDIPLHNASDRTVEVLLSCSSADNRWLFDPLVIPPIELSPKARQTVQLGTSYESNRIPESTPTCHIRVPFQTGKGVWIDYEQSIEAVYPKAS